MAIKDLLMRFMNRNQEPEEEIPDDETRDKFLRSLRRQRRTQMERLEKRKLIQQIADFERDETSKNLFGFKESLKKKDLEKVITRKKINMMKEINVFRLKKGMIESKFKKKFKKQEEEGFMEKTGI